MKIQMKGKVDMTEERFNSQDYKRSRGIYAAQSTVEYLITLIITGAFFAKLATHIGMSDSMTGITSSFASLAFMFQLLAIPMVGRLKSLKTTTLIFNSLAQFVHVSVFLTPFLNVSASVRAILVMIGIMLSYFSTYLVSGMLFKWGNSFVEPHNRGRFSAVKEMISLGCGAVFSLTAGFAFENFEKAGKIETAFLMVLIVGFLFSLINLICLFCIKKDENSNNKATSPKMKDVFDNTMKNSSFRHILILHIFWDVSRYLTVGFLATFKTNDLLIGVGVIEVMNVIAHISRLVISPAFGKYTDRTSFASGMKLGMIIAALGYIFIVFTTPKTWIFIAVYGVLNSVAFAGINANNFNITYSYVKEEYIVQAMAIKNSVGGICGFITALIAGKFLAFSQVNPFYLFGIRIYGQQILGLLSAIIVGIGAWYIKKVIEKQKRIIQ